MTELSVISTTTVVRGSVRGHGSLRVDGRVLGNIEVTGDVALGPDADVQGNISGASIAIAGTVAGDLVGTEAVMIEAGAKVIGDLRAPRIGIGDGAQVRGSVQTGEISSAALGSGFNAAGRGSLGRPAPRAVAATGMASGVGRAPLATRATPGAGGREPARPAAAAPSTSASAGRKDADSDDKPAKRSPPPPVVVAPKAGAKGRKKRIKDD
jgi:cytoskeletal protein CcmA (bactofilin family)